jgi:DNA-binding transcriptional LysR family regulator
LDIEFVRTFIKIVDTGSFIAAARNLHLTQAAISRRIRSLEEYMGCQLIVRSKSGAILTPSGKRFLRYAVNMVQTLERARHDVGVAPFYHGTLTVGGRFGLWDGLLLSWFKTVSLEQPDIQIRAEIGFEEGLMQSLIDGRLDMGIMYSPQHRPMLQIDWLLDEELILVSATKLEHGQLNSDTYVHVDWGPEFLSQLTTSLPELSSPRITVGISWLGLQYILTTGGSGYFPYRLVSGLINEGRLFPVDSAPTFQLPAYVVYPNSSKNLLLESAISLLQKVVAEVI